MPVGTSRHQNSVSDGGSAWDEEAGELKANKPESEDSDYDYDDEDPVGPHDRMGERRVQKASDNVQQTAHCWRSAARASCL